MGVERRPYPRHRRGGELVVVIDGGGLIYTRKSGWVPWRFAGALRGARFAVEVKMWFRYGRSVVPKKPEVANGSNVRAVAYKTGAILKNFPVLRSYLTDTTYEGSTDRRQPGLLIIRPSGGQWHITLKDPSTATQLRVSVDDLDRAFTALEGLLLSPECPWEDDEWQQSRGAKKRRN